MKIEGEIMTNQQRQHYAKGGIATLRQPYFLGKVVKKIGKGLKKVVKSPLGKAALIGGGLWGLNKFGPLQGKLGSMLGTGWKKFAGMPLGKQALLGLGAAGMTLPFLAGDEDEEVIEEGFDVTPSSIANIRDMARRRDPSLAFMPQSDYVQSGFYLADGGRAGLMNGGETAQAQAETMLRMEYQKYRNQGGTMSYQQFKMQVLQQAQAQGPMAQGQSQMMNKGGRAGYRLGEMVEGQGVTDKMEEIKGQMAGPDWFTRRVEALMYEGYSYEEASEIAYNEGHGGEYAQGGRVRAQEGGLMDLGGMEKDYRNDGGFVPLGEEERADDVPARLSKNEFVFTADAVRAAGGGDIDAGAEVMDNVMKNLEAGGQISEESQGQGAQRMYDTMTELETRVA